MNFKEVISQLVSTVTLVDLCNRIGIDIKKTGNSIQAICQFHDDSHPSMVLYDNNPTGGSQYHCFSCNAHGNIFDLVKEKHGVTFREAVIWLAKEYGISISQTSIQKPKKVSGVYDQVVRNVYEYALQVYKTEQDNAVLSDYISKRGYDNKIADQAKLCVKNNKNILVDHLLHIPFQIGHPFRCIPATDSVLFRPPIPLNSATP